MPCIGFFGVGSGMGDSCMIKLSWSPPVQLILCSSCQCHNAGPSSCLNYGSGSAALHHLNMGGLIQLGSQDERDVFQSSQGIQRVRAASFFSICLLVEEEGHLASHLVKQLALPKQQQGHLAPWLVDQPASLVKFAGLPFWHGGSWGIHDP